MILRKRDTVTVATVGHTAHAFTPLYSAFVALMTYLRGQYDAAKNAENNHEENPDDDDGEYLSIMLG